MGFGNSPPLILKIIPADRLNIMQHIVLERNRYFDGEHVHRLVPG